MLRDDELDSLARAVAALGDEDARRLDEAVRARIGFEDDTPATIEEIGGYVQPLADRDVRLIERVLPAGRAAVAVEKLQEAFDIRDEGAWVTIRKIADLLQGESRA